MIPQIYSTTEQKTLKTYHHVIIAALFSIAASTSHDLHCSLEIRSIR